MSDRTESFRNKEKPSIFQRHGKPSSVPSSSIKQRITAYCGKTKVNSSTNKSGGEGGSIFSNRTKIVREKPRTAPTTVTTTPRTQQQLTVSASHSTSTLDSRSNPATQTSHLHKPGFIPAYIRNKTGSKNSVSANKKQFVQIKKELTDIQTKAVECYKRYRESVTNSYKLSGTNDPPVIEELQIIDFKMKSDKSTMSLVPSAPEVKVFRNVSFSKLKQITNEKILSDISNQVHNIQLNSFKLLQEFSDRLFLINKQMKSASNSAGDTNLFPAKIHSLFEEFETKILEEEQQQNTRIINFITHLKEVMINEAGEPVIMKENLLEEFENYRKTKEIKINELDMKIKDLELEKISEEYKNAELTKTIINESSNVNKLNAALAESKAKRDDLEQEYEKLATKLKQVELFNRRIREQLEDKMHEVIAKDKTIVELKISIKTMQEKIMKYSIQVQKLGRKVARTEDMYKSQIAELIKKNDEEIKISNALRFQINEINLSMADDSRALRDENVSLKNNKTEMMSEIDSLKLSLNEILHTKPNAERSKIEDNVFRREMKRQDEELHLLKNIIIEMKEELRKRELLVAQKTQEINDIKISGKLTANFQYHEELLKLQESNQQKSNEIEQLQNELTNTENALRMVQMRSELKQSIHEREGRDGICKIKFSDLNLEIERKTHLVNQLNQEVCSKTEELENLFSTLGAQNLEVKRKNHIIKILEEKQERYQKIRLKLRGKIVRLENQNAELKHFI